MSQHYRCDVCGEEMDAPAYGISEATFLSGARSGISVNVRISPPEREGGDEPLHLCSLCYRKSVARVIHATLLSAEVWTALEGEGG